MRLEDMKRKKFWLEKEIQMAEFIIAAVQNEITPKAFIQALIEAEFDSKKEAPTRTCTHLFEENKMIDAKSDAHFKTVSQIVLVDHQKRIYQNTLKAVDKSKVKNNIYYLNKKAFDRNISKSFDYAILEKTKEINAIKLKIYWAD